MANDTIDNRKRRYYALTLPFAYPHVISRDFISKIQDSVSLFWETAFATPGSPAYDVGAGGISSISLLGREKPQPYKPHVHLLVYCRKVTRKALLRIWKDVTEKVFQVSPKYIDWQEIKEREPGEDPLLAYLAYIVKPEVYLNPELAVDVLQELSSEKTDADERRENIFRRCQLRGAFTGRGIGHH